jgi:hypothetical protein
MAPPKEKGRSDPDEPTTPPNPRATITKTPPPVRDTSDAVGEPRIVFDGTRLINL